MLHLLDIHLLTRVFKSLNGLTGLNFSLYDDRENLLIAPAKEDAVLSAVKMNRKGQGIYNEFLEKNLKHALKGAKAFAVQGPTGQLHLFMPVQYKEIAMVVLCEAVYVSVEDFTAFYREKSADYGLIGRSEEDWLEDIIVSSSETVERGMESIKPLLENIIASGYEKGELGKRWQWLKTIITLAANIKSNSSVRDIQQIVVDTVIFLFNVDTAAVFINKQGVFSPDIAGGRHRDAIQQLSIPEDSRLITESADPMSPPAIDGSRLRHSGFPEEIISMYLFPISSEIGFFGFLGIFNSLLGREAYDSVNELCKISAYLCGARYIGEEYEKRSGSLELITRKTSQLYSHYKEPQALYDNIVDEAAGLVNAEKCSLMLPDETGDVLKVFAVKGVNKWLMKDVRIKRGEGISGKVYEQGLPILIDSEQGLKNFLTEPKPLFKTPSCLSLPLKAADETIGILNFADKYSGEPFSEEDLSILSPFALQTSILLKLSSYYMTSEEMRELSITDPLTGLFNRRYFDVRIEEEYLRAKRYSLFFSLTVIDIDDFKLLNDTEGHLAGDHVLKEMASVMTGTIRANDILVRFGGEEFAIIMPQTSKEEAFHVVERIRNGISDLSFPGLKQPRNNKSLTVSAGIAMFPECGNQMENIIFHADMALYRAKSRGKNQTILWDSTMSVKGQISDSVRARRVSKRDAEGHFVKENNWPPRGIAGNGNDNPDQL